jgi:hypothetical protein
MGWFRWYEGSCEDIKLRIVARNADVTAATVTGVWAMLLEDAAHPEHRGVATRGNFFWSEVSGLAESALLKIFHYMSMMKMITRDECDDSEIIITRWHERQFETDTRDNTNAERQRRWRDKQKQNGTVTDEAVTHNGDERPDTDTEADTEADTEQKKPRANARVPAGEFEEWYAAYPKHVGIGKAREKYRAARKKASREVLLAGAKREAAKTVSDPKFIPHPATWLNQERWLDEEAKVKPGSWKSNPMLMGVK